MDIAEYSLHLDFGSGWEDFSDRIILSDGYTPRICIGKAGAHEIQTVSLKIHRSAGLGARLATTEDPIPAKLLRGGAAVMIGIIRPFNTSKAALNRMEAISLSILDRSATLEQYVFDSKRWTNLTLINRSDLSSSLIHKLFMEAGVDSADVLVDFDRSEFIPCYALSNGEYISARIQEALYEYGLTYRATAEGKFLIMDIAQDEITPALTIHADDLRTEFTLVRSDSSRKGAVVRWYPILTRNQVPVYDYEFAGTAGSLPGGGVFPPLSDTKGYRLPYDISELTDGKLLAIANASVVYEPSSLQVSTYSEYGADDCSAYLRSTITSEQQVSVFRIIADIWYQGRNYSQQVVQGRNPKTYTAKVISDAGSAQRLARILSLRQTVGQQSYSFDSSRVLEPGQIVRIIEDQVSHLDVTLRILSREYDAATELYRYTAEGAGSIDLAIPVEQIDALENALGKGRQGVSIEDVDVEYYRSTSSSSLVGGSWVTESPTWVDGTFIWSRTKVSYSDKTSFSTEPVCITGSRGAIGPQGAAGPKGDKGDTGEAGPQGIQGPAGANGQSLYTWIKYANDATGSGMADVPTGKSHIGIAYNKTTATKSSNASDYSWARIEGAQGLQGPQGATGATLYTWLKYADSPTSGMSDSPTGKLYIGLAYNKSTPTESSAYSDYSWTLIKGETGAPGRGVTSIVEYYYQSTSATTQTGGSWTTSVPAWAEGKYIWTKSRITYTDSSYVDSAPVCVTGAKGSTGSTGPKGDQGVPGSDGAAAQSFQIVASTLAYPMSSRGVVIEDRTISLSCIKANIASSVAVVWNCSALGISSYTGATLALTIPSGTELVSIDVTCTVTGFAPQTIRLTGVKEGDERSVYLGVLSVATPLLADHFTKVGGKFVAQDYYLYSTAAGNYPKWYNGTDWVAVTEDTPNYSEICATTLADTLKQSGTVLSSSAIYGFFQTLVSNDAFIKKLGAQIIKLLEGGAIHSDYYLPDGSINQSSTATRGLFLGANGLAKLWKATLEGVSLTGGSTFISDEFSTQKAGGSSATINKVINSADLTHSDAEVFFDALWDKCCAVGTYSSPYYTATISGNFKGTTFSSVKVNNYIPRTFPTYLHSIIVNGQLQLRVDTTIDDVGLTFQTVTATDVCYADYPGDSWHLEDVPTYLPSPSLINLFVTLLPTDTPCNFTGNATINYDSVSISLNGGKVSVSPTTLTFFDNNNILAGSIDTNSRLRDNTAIYINVESSIPGITTMNISPYLGDSYDIGASNKQFNRGFLKELFIGRRQVFQCRAWAFILSDGSLQGGSGIKSTARYATGHYGVAFSNSFQNNNYAIIGTPSRGDVFYTNTFTVETSTEGKTVDGCTILVHLTQGSTQAYNTPFYVAFFD